MRVLAVDPGLTRCGVAVVETRLDGRTRAVVAEVIRTDPDADHADRLRRVFDAVGSYLDDTEPDGTNLMEGGRRLSPGQIDVLLRSPLLLLR